MSMSAPLEEWFWEMHGDQYMEVESLEEVAERSLLFVLSPLHTLGDYKGKCNYAFLNKSLHFP